MEPYTHLDTAPYYSLPTIFYLKIKFVVLTTLKGNPVKRAKGFIVHDTGHVLVTSSEMVKNLFTRGLTPLSQGDNDKTVKIYIGDI